MPNGVDRFFWILKTVNSIIHHLFRSHIQAHQSIKLILDQTASVAETCTCRVKRFFHPFTHYTQHPGTSNTNDVQTTHDEIRKDTDANCPAAMPFEVDWTPMMNWKINLIITPYSEVELIHSQTRWRRNKLPIVRSHSLSSHSPTASATLTCIRMFNPVSATFRIVCLNAHTIESNTSLNWFGGMLRNALKQCVLTACNSS